MTMEETRAHVGHAHTLDSIIPKLQEIRAREGGDLPIIVALEDFSSDYSPVSREEGVTVEMYWAECAWQGERYMTPEEWAQEGPDDYPEPPDDAIRAVFIWPTN